MSIENPIIRECLAQLEAEWQAFGRAHRFMDKPKHNNTTIHSLSYGQNQLFTAEDHNRESQKLNAQQSQPGT